MFKGQPKGLFALALANTGERFGYYTMLAIFVLFIQAKFGFSEAAAGQIYGVFLAAVYFMPFIGGILADKLGYGKCVMTGIAIMFAGYIMLSVPTSAENILGKILVFASLALISVGTGLFKGNLQVMVGNLYNSPQYSHLRDSAFSLFYMAINIGAMFAPSAATKMTNFYLEKFNLSYNGEIPRLAHEFINGTIEESSLSSLTKFANEMASSMNVSQFSKFYLEKLSEAYNLGFAIACVSLIVSIAIYMACRSWFKHVEGNSVVKTNTAESKEEELSPAQTKSRITALVIVFAVVIFFWMAFHQNGLTLTFFARDYTVSQVQGWERIGFNIWSLALIAVSIYTIFGAFQSKKLSSKAILGIVSVALLSGSYMLYKNMDETIHILPQMFQQFNPFFVVALTPVSMALFAWLAKLGKEPSAPKKIALGMLVAAMGFGIMAFASHGLQMPQVEGGAMTGVNTLMSTYLVLTFAELLLSPMGISFVSKVAPPKYKGMMMGGWFAATAIGNYLCSIPAQLWNKIPLYLIWTVLIGLCLIAFLFMMLMMKRLEKTTE